MMLVMVWEYVGDVQAIRCIYIDDGFRIFLWCDFGNMMVMY